VLRSIALIAVILLLSEHAGASPKGAARTAKLRAVAGSFASVGTGFVTNDPRFTQQKSAYVLLTALHVLVPAGQLATSIEVIVQSGHSQIIDTSSLLVWPDQDIVAIPLSKEVYSALNLVALSISTKQAFVDRGATLLLYTDNLTGPIHGDATVQALVDSIEVAKHSETTAFQGLDRSTRILLYEMPTRRGMSGAPIILAKDNAVVGIHVQGVPETDKFHNLGFGINLPWTEFPEPIQLDIVSTKSFTVSVPFLDQADIENLPEEIKKRFTKLRDISFWPRYPRADGVGHSPLSAASAIFYAYSALQFRLHSPYASSLRIGLLLDKPWQFTANANSGLAISLCMAIGYSREPRDLGIEFSSDGAVWSKIAPVVSWYSLNTDKMTAISIGVGPHFTTTAIGDWSRPPDEQFGELGGLLYMRYTSVPLRLSFEFHTSFGRADKHLRSPLLTGHELGLELGVGITPVW
jgi:hypothetical protein